MTEPLTLVARDGCRIVDVDPYTPEQAWGISTAPDGSLLLCTFDVMPNGDMRLVSQQIKTEGSDEWSPDPRFIPGQIFPAEQGG